MRGAYYNENDPFAAAWLRELIKRKLIADGDVDERSITAVSASDLKGFAQCHFFAGIGGWSYALRLAGWSDDRPVWTGSCPCQPFSTAGKQEGFSDPRHLWPTWFLLIRECRPDTVFGEQVASALPWLDLVSGNLEGEGYAVGAAIVGAHSVGAPHIRQRLYWVADINGSRCTSRWSREKGDGRDATRQQSSRFREVGELGHAKSPNGRLPVQQRRSQQDQSEFSRTSEVGRMGDDARQQGRIDEVVRERTDQQLARPTGTSGFWADADWLFCRDGKYRPVKPGTFPLAHGIPGRVGRLRGYGNAIVPQVAQVFIEAYCEARGVSR